MTLWESTQGKTKDQKGLRYAEVIEPTGRNDQARDAKPLMNHRNWSREGNTGQIFTL